MDMGRFIIKDSFTYINSGVNLIIITHILRLRIFRERWDKHQDSTVFVFKDIPKKSHLLK